MKAEQFREITGRFLLNELGCQVLYMAMSIKRAPPPPFLNNFLLYFKHIIYEVENNASTVQKKWEPFLPYINL